MLLTDSFQRLSKINTRLFSRLMEPRRWRFWRPERLLMLFRDKSTTCRLFKFSNPSIFTSWFPLWTQTGRRTHLKRWVRDIHEYARTHNQQFSFIYSQWFPLINIKDMPWLLSRVREPSSPSVLRWLAGCLRLLNPDRWGLTAKQLARC